MLTNPRVQIEAISTETDRLSKGQDDIRSALDSLKAQLRNVDKGVSDVPGLVRKAKDISEEMRTELCALSILGRLGNTNQRFWDVPQADSHTFHWILRNEDESILSSHGEEQEPNRGGEVAKSASDKREKLDYENTQRDVNAQLRTWLLDGSGLFHISGKPGSGKSTLMKYLVKHSKVIESLEEWAHPKRLAFGKFFFWKPDHGQNDLDALIRGLLYSVIHCDYELVHSAFPKCSGNSFEQLSLQSKVKITKKDISEAFDNIVKDGNTSKMFKFCFFIDGLDELDEEKDTTYSRIVTILQKWADGAKDSLKICVSSRQFPVFEKMPVDYRIRLQDITKYDIINYVENSLQLPHDLQSDMSVNTENCQERIRDIVERADGVFLWVSLVVKSVEKGLSNDDPISVLRERVKSTPKGLERMFISLLDSIEDCHEQMAVLLLAVVMARSPDSGRGFERCDLSLSGCRQFFRAKETSKSVSIDDVFQIDNSPEALGLTPQRVKSTKSKLLFWCKGLLEIVPRQRGDYDDMDQYVGGRVTFLHRSIPEFLKTWIPEHMNALRLSSFHVNNAMCWMLWAEIDLLNFAIHLQPYSARDQSLTRNYIHKMACATLANLRTDVEISTAFRLLDRAENALLTPAVSLSAENQTRNNGKRDGYTWNTMRIDTSGTGRKTSCPFFAGPLLAATRTGCHVYVCWKLPNTPPSAERANYFQHCLETTLPPLLPSEELISGGVGRCMRIVEPLIKTSSVDINGTLVCCCSHLSGFLLEPGAPVSVFDLMWLMTLSRSIYTDARFQQVFFHLIESLLMLGAMPQSVLCVGTARDWFKISPGPPDGPTGIQSDSILEIPGYGLRKWPNLTEERLRMICGQNDGLITLEKLVAHAEPPNKETILLLIERNSQNEDVKSAGAGEPTSTERLHAAVLKKHGLRGNCKLVWFE